MSALKTGNADRAMALARSMVLDDPGGWYHSTFGNYSGKNEIDAYIKQTPQLPLAILGFFKNGMQSGATSIRVKRLDSGCDDNDGEDTFPALNARVGSTPFYDLRLYSGDKYFRLWPIAYVNGAFRYVAEPRPWEYFAPRAHPAGTDSSRSEGSADMDADKPATRLRQGGNVVAAKLLNRVQPSYPDVARNERLQGTVRIHALVGKDGTLEQLQVIKGYCSLSRAALDAVKKWRYSPTTFEGQPVEVDTTIDVLFFLNPR